MGERNDLGEGWPEDWGTQGIGEPDDPEDDLPESFDHWRPLNSMTGRVERESPEEFRAELDAIREREGMTDDGPFWWVRLVPRGILIAFIVYEFIHAIWN